jgi:hypothetical protein
MNDHEHYDDWDDEPIEAYCVRCRDKVDIENPQAVWTRKGMPATRGDCSICGGTVFRMGKTEAHSESTRPEAIEVTGTARKRAKLEQDTVYVSFSEPDEAIAHQLAEDLKNAGITTWLHEHEENNVNWAGGVHPALKECAQIVYVLSATSLDDEMVATTWQFFRDNRKPVVIAQVESVPPPDRIRRSPRFDLTDNYKSAFRQMIQALSQ